MFNLKAENPTALRQARVETLLESLVNKTASDLHNGDMTRDIAIPALSKIVSSVIPNSGKGHAERVAHQVNVAVDSALLEIEAQESAEDATEAA